MGTHFDMNAGAGRADLAGGGLLRALLGRDGRRVGDGLAALDGGPALAALGDSYASTSGMSPSSLLQLLRSGRLPAQGQMPRPHSASCRCPGRYAPPQSFDLAGGSPLERYLAEHPFERGQLEMALGGRIVATGGGRLSVQPFSVGAFPGGGQANQAASSALGLLGEIDRAGAGLGPDASSAFQGMMLNAMAQVLAERGALPDGVRGAAKGSGQPGTFDALRQQGRSPFVDWNEDAPHVAQRRAMFGGGGNGGRGAAAFSPAGGSFFAGSPVGAAFSPAAAGPALGPDLATAGGPGAATPQFATAAGGLGAATPQFATAAGGLGAATPQFATAAGGGYGFGGDIGAMLAEPGLTVEDKITLMLMMIMKKMDQDIESQAQYINALQQQQQAGGGGGGAPSIDVETMKLKRLIDKRSQMFDMLRQIIDKYNQTAKGIIDSMGR